MPIDKQILRRLQANDKTLTELDLNDKGLTVRDMQVLVEALSQNQTLTSLSLQRNQIGAEGAKALSLNQTLTTLVVGDNQIDKKWQTALKQRIKANQELAKIAKHFFWGQDFSFFKAKASTRHQKTYPCDVIISYTL
jgi:hypothetical protein